MVDLIAIYEDIGVKLRHSGNKYVANCPFHDEKSPSFFVYPDGSYYCFGCGAYGELDAILNKNDKKHNIMLKEFDKDKSTWYYNSIFEKYENRIFSYLKNRSCSQKYAAWKRYDELVLEFKFAAVNNPDLLGILGNFIKNAKEILE
jgi:DNA primase